MNIRPDDSQLPELPQVPVAKEASEKENRGAIINSSVNAPCRPSTIKTMVQQLSLRMKPNKNAGPEGKTGVHVEQRLQAPRKSIITTIKEKFSTAFKTTQKQAIARDPALARFSEKASQVDTNVKALLKGSGDVANLIGALKQLKIAMHKESLNNRATSESAKAATANMYVQMVLSAYSQLKTNYPEAANQLMEFFSKSLCLDDTRIAMALFNSPQFDANAVNMTCANHMLNAAAVHIENFNEVSPTMGKKILELSSLNNEPIVKLIQAAISANELSLLDTLIERNGGQIPDVDSVINQALQERNVALAVLVAKHEGAPAIEQIVSRAVDSNLESFLIQFVKETGHSLTAEQLTNFSEQAHTQGNISLMKALNPDGWQLSVAAQFGTVPEEAKSDKLIQYVLNSNLSDARECIHFLHTQGLITEKQLQAANEFSEKGCRLIARFPNPAEQKEMHQEYGKNYRNYEEQQVQYAGKRFMAVQAALDGLRANRSITLETVYNQLSGGKGWRTEGASTPIGGRYAMFKSLALEKIAQARSQKTDDIAAQSETNTALITFTSPDGQKRPLTSFSPTLRTGTPHIAYSHTNPLEGGEHWLQQLGISEDWSTLLHMNVTTSDPQSMQEFKNKIAEFYWKGVQLMPTDRGNSQTMLELHNILYQLHGLTPPAPSRNVILPDCVALCSNLKEFQQRYESCWET